MNPFKKWQYRCIAQEMTEILKTRGYDARYSEDLIEAKKMVLEMVPQGSSIALGGSVTLEEMDLYNTFKSGNYNLFDRYQKLPFNEIVEIMRQSMLADFLVTGTNAITRGGEIVNVDSSGNRAAGIIFGPKRVIIVAGANKVVDNLGEALKRLKQIAPMNALRNGHETPCVRTGKCEHCELPSRIDNAISIVNHGMKFEGRITVIMVAEEVGF